MSLLKELHANLARKFEKHESAGWTTMSLLSRWSGQEGSAVLGYLISALLYFETRINAASPLEYRVT